MFCTAHHAPRPVLVQAEVQRPADRRIQASNAKRLAPGQIFTDWASI